MDEIFDKLQAALFRDAGKDVIVWAGQEILTNPKNGRIFTAL